MAGSSRLFALAHRDLTIMDERDVGVECNVLLKLPPHSIAVAFAEDGEIGMGFAAWFRGPEY